MTNTDPWSSPATNRRPQRTQSFVTPIAENRFQALDDKSNNDSIAFGTQTPVPVTPATFLILMTTNPFSDPNRYYQAHCHKYRRHPQPNPRHSPTMTTTTITIYSCRLISTFLLASARHKNPQIQSLRHLHHPKEHWQWITEGSLPQEPYRLLLDGWWTRNPCRT